MIIVDPRRHCGLNWLVVPLLCQSGLTRRLLRDLRRLKRHPIQLHVLPLKISDLLAGEVKLLLDFSPLVPDSLHLGRLLLELSLKSLVLNLNVIVLSLQILLPLSLPVCPLSALQKLIILLLVKCDLRAVLCLEFKSEAALLIEELV
jgi:hypothetical protein